MAASTINNPEYDDAVLAEVHDMLVEIGVYEAEAEPEFSEVLLNKILKGANDITYKIFGAKGFLDFAI